MKFILKQLFSHEEFQILHFKSLGEHSIKKGTVEIKSSFGSLELWSFMGNVTGVTKEEVCVESSISLHALCEILNTENKFIMKQVE